MSSSLVIGMHFSMQFCILLHVTRLLAYELCLFGQLSLESFEFLAFRGSFLRELVRKMPLRSLQLIVQTLYLCQVLLLQVLLRTGILGA